MEGFARQSHPHVRPHLPPLLLARWSTLVHLVQGLLNVSLEGHAFPPTSDTDLNFKKLSIPCEKPYACSKHYLGRLGH